MSLRRLPTSDPGIQITTGPAPDVRLVGDADPGQVASRQAQVMQAAAQATAEGQRDAAKPLGEQAVQPTVPVETLEADTTTAPTQAAGSATAETGDTEGVDAAVNAVAEEEQGSELRAVASSAATTMTAARAQHSEQESAERQRSAEQIAALETQHEQSAATERAGLQADVAEQRGQWQSEQHAMVTAARAEAGAVSAQAGQTVAATHAQARADAAQAHAEGEREAGQARAEGEREATRHRADAEQESSGGFLGWIASRATALFDQVKQGISAAFERARQAVRAAVERAQQLATAVIERARQVVVAAIQAAGAALTAIGDRLLAGFPALRDRFRNAIRAAVRRAGAAVNQLADRLKAGVRAALGLLGRGLSALLSGLEASLRAAVDAVAASVRSAISAARAALEALGAFMAIAKDVAENPGGWLRNLGAAVLDGLRNHLWRALKTAVQQWFNDKVEQVLGLGRAVWNLLTRGGISLAQIGRMAWEGIKQAIPAALISLLVEKLASMIIPAAGAVLAIIQGLQAAWGAVSRVLQAIDRFVRFLKAVKSGNGGPAFAAAVAAAGVAVVDFVSNWLLARLARGASAVAGRVRAIAQRIGAALRRVATRVGGALRRFGRRIADRFRGARDRFRAWRERRRGRPRETPADRERRLRERLERAVAAIKPHAARMLAKGTTPTMFALRLAYWRLRHRLRSLSMDGSGAITATLNPTITLDQPQGRRVTESELGALLTPIFRQAEVRFIQSQGNSPQRAAAAQAWERGDPHALDGLSRAEQQSILRNSQPGRPSMRAESEISVGMSERNLAGRRTGQVGMVPGPGDYRGMTARLLSQGRQFKLTRNDIAEALSTGRVDEARLLSQMQGGGPVGRQAFVDRLRRISFLVHAVEPSRKLGHGVSSAAAFSMLSERPELLRNVVEGNMAPMAPRGAASQRDTKTTWTAVGQNRRNVGAIFSTLLEAAKGPKPLVAKSGADLNGLAEAVRRWLAQQLAAKQDAAALAQAREELLLQLRALLTTFYGRAS